VVDVEDQREVDRVGSGRQGFVQDAVAPDAFEGEAAQLVLVEVVGRDRSGAAVSWLISAQLSRKTAKSRANINHEIASQSDGGMKTTPMIGKLGTLFKGSRGDSAGLMAYGIAALVAWLWFPYLALLVAGVVVTVAGAVSLAADLRRGRAWHEQDVLLRRLWAAVKRIPSGYVLADPDTGELLSAEREKGWLTLAVTDPPEPGRASTVTATWSASGPPQTRHRCTGTWRRWMICRPRDGGCASMPGWRTSTPRPARWR
jgi:hypothetical protein